jgi:hypothetical protein
MTREFAPKLLEVSGQTASVLSPVPFQGRVDELTLERWIVDCPELVGEPLLILGRQLADDWEPSQYVRIKLLAPNFPRRVLKTVKWLGDGYDMPIEAIAVRLFEDSEARYSLSFERILPLPGEEEFDLTVRRREDRKRAENTTRRRQPPIIPLLLEHGVLKDGQTLWLAKERLPLGQRGAFDPENPAFQVRLRVIDGSGPRFEWRPTETDPYETLPPSEVFYRVWRDVFDLERKPFSTAVANRFTTEPDGQTLARIALARGLWTPEGESPTGLDSRDGR